MRYPLLGKAAALGAVTLALVAALGTVGGIVAEREGRLREAEQNVMDSLAGRQTLVGPVLHRQCEESWDATQQVEGQPQRVVRMRREFSTTALPKSLNVKADARQEPRYRGIFKVNGYALKAEVQAGFAESQWAMPGATMKQGVVMCKAPVLWMAVGDARGLARAELRLNGSPLPVSPGTLQRSHPRGFHAVVPEPMPTPGAGDWRVQAQLELLGTAQLAFAPVADDNQVELVSDWAHPSFAGRSLPGNRDVTPKGFTARWQLSALATAAGQQLANGGVACGLDGRPSFYPAQPVSAPAGSDEARMATPAAAAGVAPPDCIETFGVNFIDPVNSYVLADRATKYGLLFIGLTFVGVALVEVQRRLRVHPIQYLLVGCALALFFLLLVSLGEHLAFAWAYAAASAACTALLTFYGCFVLRGLRAGLAFGGAVGVLYGALFLLLRMEQSALVLGSVLLFAVLAAVMFATRRIDWYAFTADIRRQEQRPT